MILLYSMFNEQHCILIGQQLLIILLRYIFLKKKKKKNNVSDVFLSLAIDKENNCSVDSKNQ